MWDYYVYIVLGAALLAYWLVAAYLTEIKEYIRKVFHNHHWNFPNHNHG